MKTPLCDAATSDRVPPPLFCIVVKAVDGRSSPGPCGDWRQPSCATVAVFVSRSIWWRALGRAQDLGRPCWLRGTPPKIHVDWILNEQSLTKIRSTRERPEKIVLIELVDEYLGPLAPCPRRFIVLVC